MRRRQKQAVALVASAMAVTLAWPGPSGADTSLGGYSGYAQAMPVRIQIYEPTIPIPASPQIDAGIGFTRSTTDTGPVSRALASYLWPGDTIGDGFGQLMGGSNATYLVQTNSRYPATPTAPAQNAWQLSDGNGQSTSSNENETKASVTGLGIGANLLSNPLKIFPPKTSSPSPTGTAAAKPPALPIPVSGQLAGLISIGNVTSTSDIKLATKTVTSIAHAAISDVSIAGGLIKIGAISLTSTAVSDGTKGTTTSTMTIGGVTIAGQAIGLDEKGVSLAGNALTLPKLPDLLSSLGFSVDYAPTQKKVSGADASFEASGLVITIDTNPLKNLLNVRSLTDPIAKLLNKIPKIGSQLAGLINLGPKIVLSIGNVTSTATAAPAYTGGTGGTVNPQPGSGSSGGGGIVGGGSTGGGNITTGGGLGTGTGTGAGTTGGGSGGGGPTIGVQPASASFPALGSVPRLLILGGIVLAAALGWALRAAAMAAFGGAGSCSMGLATGVPDLRKG
jgi:hypothetical protein